MCEFSTGKDNARKENCQTYVEYLCWQNRCFRRGILKVRCASISKNNENEGQKENINSQIKEKREIKNLFKTIATIE